jgi:hypothetical protein
MTQEKLYELAYDAHEWAEDAALTAFIQKLGEQSLEALSCLADPSWQWKTRSFLSETIIDLANQVLNEKLDALAA